MNEKLTRLQELLDRKLTLTSKMDSFQISAEIAEAILDLLKLIFKPYPIQTVTRGELAHTPDAVLAYEPLGKVKIASF